MRVVPFGVALLLAVVLLAGCGPYRTYTGPPKAFSTHPYRISLPRAFPASELPQMSTEVIVLTLRTENKPMTPNAPEMPGMILVRCHRMRKQETPQTFMERYYDNLEPHFLDIDLRQVGHDSQAPEWRMTVGPGYFAARVIVLPREKLAYEVATMCRPDQLKGFEEVFRRARDSFQLLPARR
jgi:hypothetical protein